jgi:hypothetical protein
MFGVRFVEFQDKPTVHSSSMSAVIPTRADLMDQIRHRESHSGLNEWARCRLHRNCASLIERSVSGAT